MGMREFIVLLAVVFPVQFLLCYFLVPELANFGILVNFGIWPYRGVLYILVNLAIIVSVFTAFAGFGMVVAQVISIIFPVPLLRLGILTIATLASSVAFVGFLHIVRFAVFSIT